MMDMCDEATKASCLDWSTAFKQECSALFAANGDAVLAASGDAALAASDYDKAIELYSAAIDLDSASDMIFAMRSKAKLAKTLWADALLDAQKVIELNPSSYVGYELKHAALHGAQRYDEAIEVFQVMLSKLENSADAQLRELRRQYASPSETRAAIRRIIDAQLEYIPLRLINTPTGLICDRESQINVFESSTEYKELLSMMHREPRIKDIQDVVAKYFGYVMLSHRWEGKEPLLYDIQDRSVYELNSVDGILKLQQFCKTSRDAGYGWAWSDTCCINKNDDVELYKSVNSMFGWYRYSALTVVYLSDVPPSARSGALAGSAWNTRGWTVGEFLAPKVVLFYQTNWTLYLGERSPNHKKSVAIMQELEDASGIDAQNLVAFRPGMINPRQMLHWASTRVTTLQEDIAYSLFGVFGVQLPVRYGEKKQNALGRLLQEIVAQSGDISALDWAGKPSEFNSCLPADISSYEAPQIMFPYLSEDEIQASALSLQVTVAEEVALELYNQLYGMPPPRFANQRLHLPCIVFHVTEVRRRRDQDQETCFTYGMKADGLHDSLITTEDKLIQFSRAKPTLQNFMLVCPWDRRLLELPDFSADTQSMDDWPDSPCWSPVEQRSVASESSEREDLPHFADDIEIVEDYLTPPESPIHDSADWSPTEPVDSEFHSRALRLIVRLQQPFCALLLAQLRSGEYKRIASDHDIIVQVKDVRNMMDIRTLEIL
ncbi:hypothetical protein BDR05DRAFT_631425 [Suillus weaverae]|nr:hypothetical protein BDR05DRAFT_631425 [Suillus weaverae]